MSQKLIDASTALSFLSQQGSAIEAEVYRQQYPEIQYPQLIPVDTSAGEWANNVEFYSIDTVGKAEWFQGSASDMPRADVAMTKFNQRIGMAGIGYGYDLEEVGFAQRINMNLNAEKAIAARRAYEEFMEGLVLSGSAIKNMLGLINQSGVTATTAPADGTASATTFASKTGDQIARDINSQLSLINTGSNGVEVADTILMPIVQYNLLATKRMGTDGASITVMEWLMKYNTYTARTGRPLVIRTVYQLTGAGAGSTDRLVAYRRDPGVVKLHLPMPHRFLPVWQTGPLRFDIPGVFRTGGVEVRRPAAFRYLDGI